MVVPFSRRKSARQQQSPSRGHALDCIPVRNPHLSEEADDSGELRISYPVQIRPWFQGIFKKLANRQSDIIVRKLQLDVLGATVWQLIDGKRNVREIITLFQTSQQLNRREAEISVCTFLRELGKRGVIALQDE